MAITDPIVGGLYLIRAAIRSPNYKATPAAGWTINQDGSASFSNITIVAPGSSGAYVAITGGEIDIFPSNNIGNMLLPAVLKASQQSAGPVLTVTSPQQLGTTPNDTSSLTLQGANSTAAPAPNGSVATLTAWTVQLSSDGSALVTLGANVELSAGGTKLWTVASPATNYDCSGNLTLTTTSQPITGCTATYNGLYGPSKWKAILTVDSSIGTTAGVTNIGELWVSANGAAAVKQTGDVEHATGVSTRGSFSKSWSGTFAAGGQLVFTAQGRFTGGGGLNAFFSPNTTLQIEILQ